MLKITQEDVNNGCIPVDSQFAKEIGFISDKFGGYLWLEGNTVWLSLIVSLNEGQGNVRKLIKTIKDKGYSIKTLPVSARMIEICKSMGFEIEGEFMRY